MTIGGGRIAFAHVEQVIDFKDLEGIRRYVEKHKYNDIMYLSYVNNSNQHEMTHIFDEEKHIAKNGSEDRPYTITVWIPYKEFNMGC